MMQDTINSIRVTLSERIGNPFISAAIIACILLNWKLSLLLFSDVPYDLKVEKIVALYPDSSTRLENFLVIPLCFGIFWTFIWPVISMGINAYWYRMRSHISNVKLQAERKKKLSEAEAAELYSTIDAQESKYLEFLKDRQNKIDGLTRHIADVTKEHGDRQLEIEKYRLTNANLESKLSALQGELSVSRENSEKYRRESEERQRSLDEILSHSLQFAAHLPGLKAITNAINRTTNFQANEAWVREELKRQEPTVTDEDQSKMINFFLALGLIKRDSNNNVMFGDRYRYEKDKILGLYNNSPGPKKPQ